VAAVPASPVEDHHRVAIGSNLAADLGEMVVHGNSIADRHDQCCRLARRGTDRTKHIADLRSLALSERRRRLQAVLPRESRAISEVLSVGGRGRRLFELICTHDLEGIVAKRSGDLYQPRTRWLKMKNRDYSQAEGRADLLNRQQ
jgi:hypothetical protein